MSDVTIPEDVMKTAKAVAYAVEGSSRDGWITSLNGVDVIARAILAERERCAKIVEAHELEFVLATTREAAGERPGAQHAIAQAIRGLE